MYSVYGEARQKLAPACKEIGLDSVYE